MSDWLQGFVGALRRSGLAVSPAEAIDAARAALAVGPEDRRRLRSALAITLAKDPMSRARFDEIFDCYFVPPARGEAPGAAGAAPGGSGGGGAGGSGAGGRRPTGRPTPRAEADEPVPRRGSGTPARPAERSHRGGIRRLRPEEIRSELERTAARGERTPRGKESPQKRKEGRGIRPLLLPSHDKKPQGPAGAAARPPRLARLIAGPAESRPPGQTDPRRRDLRAPATSEEERRLAREIPRILEEIRLRHSRRHRRAAHGRQWVKRAIRENLATGGVPFRIPMRATVRRRPRVVAVVDVSWSVLRASSLFLALALELLKGDKRARIFLFVDRPVEAGDVLARWIKSFPAPEARAPAFREAIRALPDLDPNAASDYGRAFYMLASGPLRRLARDAVLVVLGDGRTNRFDPLPWAFEEIAARARRVIWLVPEARDRWGAGDSALARYLPLCDVAVEARDLEGLAHGVRELAASV